MNGGFKATVSSSPGIRKSQQGVAIARANHRSQDRIHNEKIPSLAVQVTYFHADVPGYFMLHFHVPCKCAWTTLRKLCGNLRTRATIRYQKNILKRSWRAADCSRR